MDTPSPSPENTPGAADTHSLDPTRMNRLDPSLSGVARSRIWDYRAMVALRSPAYTGYTRTRCQEFVVMKRRVHGQSMVELALILPFLVLITIGTMELGYYIYTYSELENATRRASETAAKTPPWTAQSCDDVPAPGTRPASCPAQLNAETRDECAVLIRQAAVDGVLFSRLTPTNFTLTISYPVVPTQQTRQKGDQIQVQTTYRGEWLTPIGRRFFGNALNFSFTSRRTISSLRPPDGLQPWCQRNP